MTRETIRLCKSCQEPLPDNAQKRQKYCSATCRERMKKRRQRLTSASEHSVGTTELDRLRLADQQFDRLQVEHRKLRQQLKSRDLKIKRLDHALQRSEHQVEVAANEQALRTRAVREELAGAKWEMSKLKRNWSVQSATDDEKVTRLRSDLATVTADYNELATKYKELTASAKSAAEERKHLKGIVRQWDYLCKRLHVATKGRPRNDSDKKILATWSQFRKQVQK